MKVTFVDCSAVASFKIKSTWKNKKNQKSCDSSTQTKELDENCDNSTQSGLRTEILQSIVIEGNKDSVLDIISKKNPKKSKQLLINAIIDGCLIVNDIDIVNDPAFVPDPKSYLELTIRKFDANTQTESQELSFSQSYVDEILESPSFLQNIAFVEKILEDNIISLLKDNLNVSLGNLSNPDILPWSILFVDLVRYKVVYADWLSSDFQTGKIIATNISRNKERIYDIDFDDGFKQSSMKEEYIRLLVSKSSQSGGVEQDKKKILKEGIRVHFRPPTSNQGKSSLIKYYPGRIVECHKSGMFSIEYENGVCKSVTSDDIIIGLTTGQMVEAKKPEYVKLECTSVSWNATGNTIASSYGKVSLNGWNNYPGAICMWNLFSRSGFTNNQPNNVLDHSSPITLLAYHPDIPSMLVSSTFNGEIMLWNTTRPEIPIATSLISFYSHNGPVKKVFWIKNFDYSKKLSKTVVYSNYWIVSCGVDGKIMFWSESNELKFPFKGFYVSDDTSNKKLSFQSVCSISFSNSKRSSNVKKGGSDIVWMIVGLENGKIYRVQMNKIFDLSPTITNDTLRKNVPLEDVFIPILKYGYSMYDGHIGPVSSIDHSPFHRNLFLTAGDDGFLRLYHILGRTPIMQWEPATSNTLSVQTPLTACAFSPIRPCVWACSSVNGYIFLFDFMISKCGPIQVLDIESSINSYNLKNNNPSVKNKQENILKFDKSENSGITDISFNHKQRDFIAASTFNGEIHIWKMSSHFSCKTVEEQNVIGELGNTIIN